jgi:hypothetical protein
MIGSGAISRIGATLPCDRRLRSGILTITRPPSNTRWKAATPGARAKAGKRSSGGITQNGFTSRCTSRRCYPLPARLLRTVVRDTPRYLTRWPQVFVALRFRISRSCFARGSCARSAFPTITGRLVMGNAFARMAWLSIFSKVAVALHRPRRSSSRPTYC